jgi:hypothetical protein
MVYFMRMNVKTLELEAQAAHACKVVLDHCLAFLGGLVAVFQEAVISG